MAGCGIRGRGATTNHIGVGGQRRGPGGAVRAQLLARAHGCARLRHRVPGAAGIRVCLLCGRPGRVPAPPPDAGDRARLRSGRRHHAADPVGDDRGVGNDYVRTARAKGLGGRAGDTRPRPAQQPHRRHDDRRPATRRAHLGGGGHRTDLRAAGVRQAHPRRGVHAGLPDDPGRRARDGHGLHRHQPVGRPAVLGDRPTHPSRGTVCEHR